MKKTAYLLLLTLIALLPATAKQRENKVLVDSAVCITAHELMRTPDNQVYFNLDIRLSEDFRMSSNRKTHLVPIFTSADNSQEKTFAPIVIYGRRREIIDWREGLTPTDAYRVVRRERGDEQNLNYTAAIPYESWMEEGNLKLWVDLCGCADNRQEEALIPVGKLLSPFDPISTVETGVMVPTGSKITSLSGRAYIQYPVDSIQVFPYRWDNPQELKKIENTINKVRVARIPGLVKIDSIHIRGFASPEGRYRRNVWLAENRARSLRDYVRSTYDLTDVPFTTSSVPEDWEGLRDTILRGDLPEKEQILAIIDDPAIKSPDARNDRLARLPIYKQTLLPGIYPRLRHSDYTVYYTVREMSDTEIREVYSTHPWLLKPEDFHRLAKQMKPGTADYIRLYITAVGLYPNDSVANLNAGAAALQLGTLDEAQKYLDRAGKGAEADCNRAVLAFKQERYDAAYRLFVSAANAGSRQADEALTQMLKRAAIPVEKTPDGKWRVKK